MNFTMQVSGIVSKRVSMSQLSSIRHDIPVPLHTPGAYGQCSVFHHSGDKQSVVLGTRYGTWWSWYGQFEVAWLQPLQLWLSAGISLVGLDGICLTMTHVFQDILAILYM